MPCMARRRRWVSEVVRLAIGALSAGSWPLAEYAYQRPPKSPLLVVVAELLGSLALGAAAFWFITRTTVAERYLEFWSVPRSKLFVVAVQLCFPLGAGIVWTLVVFFATRGR